MIRKTHTQFFGGDCDKVTPVPIPNTASFNKRGKLICADGTARAAERPSKSPPDFFISMQAYIRIPYFANHPVHMACRMNKIHCMRLTRFILAIYARMLSPNISPVRRRARFFTSGKQTGP